MPVRAPKIAAVDRVLLDAAGAHRAAMTAALWPEAPQVVARVTTSPAEIAQVPAGWVAPILALCDPATVAAAGEADTRVVTRKAVTSLTSSAPKAGPRPGTQAYRRQFTSTMTKLYRAFDDWGDPFDDAWQVLGDAADAVALACEYWASDSDDTAATGMPLAFTPAQALAIDKAPTWVIGEILCRLPTWGPAEVGAVAHLSQIGYRGHSTTRRLMCLATPTLSDDGVAHLRKWRASGCFDPEGAVLLSALASEPLGPPTSLESYTPDLLAAAAVLATRLSAQNRPAGAVLYDWVLATATAPLAPSNSWRLRPSMSHPRLVRALLAALPANDPLRAALLAHADATAAALLEQLASDDELATWAVAFATVYDAYDYMRNTRMRQVLADPQLPRASLQLILDAPGVAGAARVGGFGDDGARVLAAALGQMLDGQPTHVWQLVLDWLGDDDVILRQVCTSACVMAASPAAV